MPDDAQRLADPRRAEPHRHSVRRQRRQLDEREVARVRGADHGPGDEQPALAQPRPVPQVYRAVCDERPVLDPREEHIDRLVLGDDVPARDEPPPAAIDDEPRAGGLSLGADPRARRERNGRRLRECGGEGECVHGAGSVRLGGRFYHATTFTRAGVSLYATGHR